MLLLVPVLIMTNMYPSELIEIIWKLLESYVCKNITFYKEN